MSFFPRQHPRILKPTGHSAFAERVREPAVGLGTFILVAVGCYVWAAPDIAQLFVGQVSISLIVDLILVGGLGMLLALAAIISAARFRMHVSRGKRDRGYAILTGTMLILIVAVESATVLQFGYLIAPATFPLGLVSVMQTIHTTVFFLRWPLLPALLIYLTVGILPVTIEQSDRNRETKATTSQNIARIQAALVEVSLGDNPTRAELIQALADQHALNEHAADATPAEIAHDEELIRRLRQQGMPSTPSFPLDDAPTSLPSSGDWSAPLTRGRAPHVSTSSDALVSNGHRQGS